MKSLVCTVVVLVGLSYAASAQSHYLDNAGFSGGYTHISGYSGTNGFDVGAEVILVRPVSIGFDYDGAWNSSSLTSFSTTSIGLASTHTHLQDFIVGPRAYFPLAFKNKDANGPCGGKWGSLRSLMPFVEAQFGVSHINQSLSVQNFPPFPSASNTAFTWELGGGADIRMNPHWAFRGKVDLLRTHFVSAGQSHARIGLGLIYTVKPRPKWEK